MDRKERIRIVRHTLESALCRLEDAIEGLHDDATAWDIDATAWDVDAVRLVMVTALTALNNISD